MKALFEVQILYLKSGIDRFSFEIMVKISVLDLKSYRKYFLPKTFFMTNIGMALSEKYANMNKKAFKHNLKTCILIAF